MALADRARLVQIFGWSTDLNTISWRAPIDALAGGASLVDVTVTADDPPSLSDNNRMGLAWWGGGLVARGEQLIRDGQTVVLRNVVVRAGDELVAASDGVRLFVKVSPAGTAREPEPPPPGPGVLDALKGAAEGFGSGAGRAVVLVLVVAGVVLALQARGRA